MKKNMLRILTALTFFIISATQTYAQTGGTTRYVYDDNGRLHIVIASNGEAAIYTWDPAGNPISITRSNDPNATVRITSFTPGNGAPGTTVTINGTGFSSTAGQNIVRFNGVAAVVNSATTTQIVTSVPVRATSGPLTVTTPAGSAISPVTFIIPLSISGFAPKIGTPGTSVSITGNSFELNPSDNRVRFHQTPSVVSYATFTNLVTSVPAGATSGRISITTPFETFVSSDDFFVPPVPYTAADVSATARMTIGTSKIVGLEAPKIGLIVFDGVAGQRIGLQTVTSIEDSLLSVYKPDGTLLVPPRGIAFVLNVGFQSVLEPQVLPVTGTYTILISNIGTHVIGSVNLTLYEAPPDLAGTIAPGDPPVTVTTTAPGQTARLTFSGTAGQAVRLQISNATNPFNIVNIFNPDGTILDGSYLLQGGGSIFINPPPLPATGTYTILFSPSFPETGSLTLALYDVVTDIIRTITPGGAAVTITTTAPGQNARLTFSGTAGQKLILQMSGVTIASSQVEISAPDDSVLVNTTYLSHTSGGMIDLPPLPATGTYTIRVVTINDSMGTMTLKLADQPPNPAVTIALSDIPTDTPIALSDAAPEVRLTFQGTTGQLRGLSLSNVTMPSSRVIIYNPDGTVLVEPENLSTQYGSTLFFFIPTDGVYTIVISTTGAGSGGMRAQLTDGSVG